MMSSSEQSNTGAGPSRPRDDAAIRRKVYAAVTEADDLLRELWHDLGRIDDPSYYRTEIRRVRGLLAEWRLERG